jgi:hypothetical protein
LIAFVAILATIPVEEVGFQAMGPAFAQSPNTVTLDGIFDPDLADVLPGGREKLKDAVDRAKVHSDSCYPPRATFTALTHTGGDPLFVKTLAEARQAALEHVLRGSLGLDPEQFKTEREVVDTGNSGDDVRVTYDKPDDDTDAPVLKVSSTPRKGTKVKAGDQIKVTIRASERYADGHKSWPSGVRSLQLIADDGLVQPIGDYGMRPPPCERRTLEVTYTVPSKPPLIVHLTALTEDAVGNKNFESAEFPTVSGFKFSGVHFDWLPSQGRLIMHDDFSGRLCGDPFKDAWSMSFTNTEEISGKTKTVSLSGPASGIQFQGGTSSV